MRTIQHSTCSVIPRHMLQHIAVHGDDDARETVSSTLHHSALIARERATSYLKPSIRKKSGSQKRSVYDAQNLAHASGRLRLDARRRLGEFQGRQGPGHGSRRRFAEGRHGAEAPDRLMTQPQRSTTGARASGLRFFRGFLPAAVIVLSHTTKWTRMTRCFLSLHRRRGPSPDPRLRRWAQTRVSVPHWPSVFAV